MARLAPSMSDADLAAFVDKMCLYCELKALAAGDTLRVRDRHYRDMYLITHGECAVDLDPDNPSSIPIVRGPGQPIGEIGFLRGMAATATVTAKGHMQAMLIDDETIALLEAREPELIAALLQRLSGIADDRTSYNVTQMDAAAPADLPSDTEILLCRNAKMMRQAQGLRYEVYCEELGRTPRSANKKKRAIADPLDTFAHCFMATHEGRPIGTIRINLASEGMPGSLEQIYGMGRSEHHPLATALASMFVVARDLRHTSLAMRLLSQAMQYARSHGTKVSFVDCVPELEHYYRAMGFVPSQGTFFHPEHGPSIPMRIDLEKHAKALGAPDGWGRKIAFHAKARAYKLANVLRG